MRRIGFLVFPGCSLLDFTGPLTAFDVANRLAAHPAYRIEVLSEAGAQVQSAPGLVMQTQALDDPAFDTLVISGGNGPRDDAFSPGLIAFVREAAQHSRRMTSVCSGAFALAAAGLLDGRRATTHWRMAAQLQRRYPRVHVQADRIFIQDGPVWTSAGISSGIDLALALIEADLGIDVSRAVARELVVYHRRPGGQSQFSALLELDPASTRIARALSYARDHLHEALDVDRLAEVAHLSRRQFDRAFVAETGQTPAKAIEKLRAEAARPRVEAGNESLEHIARAVGFADPERMRRAFIRVFGHPPQSVRRSGRLVRAQLAA
jgi:transcriptional regulator GlxA family with amidase domain|uniref:Transcriptional regulator, AraC family n=2 Tax=Ralstonia pickettii TaxID=329 RepID=C6BLQ0_RALP1